MLGSRRFVSVKSSRQSNLLVDSPAKETFQVQNITPQIEQDQISESKVTEIESSSPIIDEGLTSVYDAPFFGFTQTNELFVGRMAMFGFAAALAGEIITGKGALGQLSLETGITDIYQLNAIIAVVALFNVVASLIQTRGKLDVQEKMLNRQPGPLQDPNVFLSNPKQFFGFSKFGSFSRENEIFVGRLAQLGFLASLVGETLTGYGPLAQFGLQTGIPLNLTGPILITFITVTYLASVNDGAQKRVQQ